MATPLTLADLTPEHLDHIITITGESEWGQRAALNGILLGYIYTPEDEVAGEDACVTVFLADYPKALELGPYCTVTIEPPAPELSFNINAAPGEPIFPTPRTPRRFDA